MTPQERQDIIDDLTEQIRYSLECAEDDDDADWIARTGVLITRKHAELILKLLQELK